MTIYTVSGDDGSCLLFQIFKRNISSSMKKEKWSPNSWRKIKHLWSPSHKKWGQNCVQEEKGHAEHCTASSVRCYSDIPIRWKFILQIQIFLVLTSEYKFPRVAVQTTSEFSVSLNVTTNFMTLIPEFILTNQHSCIKRMFLKKQSTFNFLSRFSRDWYPCL